MTTWGVPGYSFFMCVRGMLMLAIGLMSASLLPSASSAETTADYRVEEEPDSVSCGSVNRGALSDATMMPDQGRGFVSAEPWRSRGSRYGTKELVGLITRAAGRVADEYEGAKLSVADLSLEHGGPITGHRSHQNGRDVDLIYYSMDSEGRPYSPDSHMAYYNRLGQATYAKAPKFVRDIPERYFDLARNWSFVKAVLQDRETEVERIFVSPRIERWLINYARQSNESQELIERASRILHAPREVKGHNDHMHLRIRCSAEDIEAGNCKNAPAPKPRRGNRWYRKHRCPKAAPLVRLPS